MIAKLLRNRWIAASLVVAVAAVGVGLYLFQPWRVWTSHEVQDALPVVPVPSATLESSAAQSSAAQSSAAQSSAAQSSAAPADRLLSQGAFVTHEHDTSGQAQIVRLADGRHQLVLRDLDTSDGPDLRVWLTDREVVAGRAGWDVFDDGRHVEVAPLKGNRGNQVYDIPATVDLDGLRSVSIWCKRFAVSFGAAPLTAV
jgi:hypothetical protein